MEDRLKNGADKWRTESFKPRTEFWEGEQIVGMEQNGDKNDAGTDSHYSGNHYVDNRLLDTRR